MDNDKFLFFPSFLRFIRDDDKHLENPADDDHPYATTVTILPSMFAYGCFIVNTGHKLEKYRIKKDTVCDRYYVGE